MDFLASLVTLIVVCTIIGLPCVLLGNYVYGKWIDKNNK